jgi:phosphoenolpyruvate-protein phosphotransferase
MLLNGIAVSKGIAVGPVFQFRPPSSSVAFETTDTPKVELDRFRSALEIARRQLNEIRQKTENELGKEHAGIFQAHLLMLEDPEIIKSVEKSILEENLKAEPAQARSFEKYAKSLEAMADEYFQARAADVRDVSNRLLNILTGRHEDHLGELKVPSILVAEDLTPSDTMTLDKNLVLGFATALGGPTSHTAILARSIGLPAVVGIGKNVLDIPEGATIVLDGGQGSLIINPDAETIQKYETFKQQVKEAFNQARSRAGEPATTSDGHTVEVVANIGSLKEARLARELGAEGIGLFRTEFLFLSRDSMPSESEQVDTYREIFKVFRHKPIVVRTLDIGGDKDAKYLGIANEANPFLGWRAIRMAGDRPDILLTQFKALLKAGDGMDLRIMIPLVSNLDEVDRAASIFNEALQSLKMERGNFQLGIMIEVPSAALLADKFAKKVDFFSIGTNDLAQYTLAVDRTNERVADLGSPFHPAVLKLIAQTIQAAHEKGIWVGLCGEMAGNPLAAPLLLGLALDEFSMAPMAIPELKETIRKLSYKECKILALEALELATTQQVLEFLQERIKL